jgi:hypothetical protein
MLATWLGHSLFAIGFTGLGVLSLGSGDFALNWQPVPAWIHWREALAYASGLMVFASGLGLLDHVRRWFETNGRKNRLFSGPQCSQFVQDLGECRPL